MTPRNNEALSFAYLDGAIVAARTIGSWALSSGFGAENVRVVDDGSNGAPGTPVTRERVQRAVDQLFPTGADGVEQLMLAFCGHGLTDENVGSISWLFSDSLENKYRVVADRFQAELLLHGIERITLITDACREAPKFIDLTRLDAVRGIVVQGNQVESPKVDRLASCQDGQLGYMVSDPMSALPGKCVFSGVITDALWGREPEAITNGLITTGALGACVRSRTKERAKEYGLSLNPQCSVDPVSAVLFDTANPLPDPDGLQPWPPLPPLVVGKSDGLNQQAAALDLGSADETFERVRADSNFREQVLGRGFGLKGSGAVIPDDDVCKIPAESKDVLQQLAVLRRSPEALPHRRQSMRALIKRLEADVKVEERRLSASEVRRRFDLVRHPAEANLFVWGRGVEVHSSQPIERFNTSLEFERFRVIGGLRGDPILIEISGRRYIPVVPYGGLYAVVTSSDNADVFLAYGTRFNDRAYKKATSVVDDLAAGRIRVDQVDELAGRLRIGKHVDPTIGVICAHLYRAVADFDSIRRMAYFYAYHEQPVPFDIALLGDMQVTQDADGELRLHIPGVRARTHRMQGADLPGFVTQATPAEQAWIGGRCPWLGLGWDYVQDPRPEWLPLVEHLSDYAPMVRRSGFTVLPTDVGEELAARWGLRPS